MTLTARWIDPSQYDDEDLVSAFDDLSLWSAPFGLALLDTIRMREVQAVLDVGCGAGFPLVELADRFGPRCRVAGVDPWRAAAERARAKARTRGLSNVEVVLGKAEELPFPDGTFDLVVSNNGLNNVADPRRALAECARASREGAEGGGPGASPPAGAGAAAGRDAGESASGVEHENELAHASARARIRRDCRTTPSS